MTIKKNNQGFSLIEVMIALIIASISLVALSATLGQYLFNQSSIKERVVATWVAQNRILEVQNSFGTTIEKNKVETMLGTDWQTEFESKSTLIPGLNKVTISVKLKDTKYPAAKVVSIVGK
jgi:general secretion pathway protein I